MRKIFGKIFLEPLVRSEKKIQLKWQPIYHLRVSACKVTCSLLLSYISFDLLFYKFATSNFDIIKHILLLFLGSKASIMYRVTFWMYRHDHWILFCIDHINVDYTDFVCFSGKKMIIWYRKSYDEILDIENFILFIFVYPLFSEIYSELFSAVTWNVSSDIILIHTIENDLMLCLLLLQLLQLHTSVRLDEQVRLITTYLFVLNQFCLSSIMRASPC